MALLNFAGVDGAGARLKLPMHFVPPSGVRGPQSHVIKSSMPLIIVSGWGGLPGM